MGIFIGLILPGILLFGAIFFASLHLLSDHLRTKAIDENTPRGCRRVGLQNRSNMADEYSPEHSGKDKSLAPRVKALFIFPVKSCGPVELTASDLVATGLRYDRQFCFAQLKSEEAEKAEGDFSTGSKWVHRWKFITQRSVPRLSQISTEVWLPDPASRTFSPNGEWVRSKGCVVCRFTFSPDWRSFDMEGLKGFLTIVKAKLAQRNVFGEPMVSFRLPIAPDPVQSTKHWKEVMDIWKDSPEAINVSAEIPPDTMAKLKYFLGVSNPLAIFQADPEKRRDVFRNAPRKEEAGYQPGVGFADAYPLHILSLSSVQELNSKMAPGVRIPLSALRFRANVYLTGSAPFAEDDWKLIRIRNSTYHVSCRTTRCDLPNVDPLTGIKDRKEPYLTLKTVRGNVDKGAGAHPCLGMQMVPLLKDPDGSEDIAVGDEVEVLETGEHFYVRMFQ